MTHGVPLDTTTGSGRGGWLVTVLAFTGLTSTMVHTALIPVLPQLAPRLGADPADVSWTITVTLLTSAVTLPIAGRLGDTLGKRRVLLACLAALVVGSLVCGLATSLAPMILGRGLQGLATSAIPLGMSILRDLLPPAGLASGVAVISATLGAGGAVMLPVTALIGQVADFHLVFAVTAALGLLAMLAVRRVVPPDGAPRSARFDIPGAVGLTIGLTALLTAVTKGGTWGWAEPLTLGVVGGSALVLVGWARWELRTAEPLLDLRVSATAPVLLTNTASLLAGFAMYCNSMVLPQLLQAPTSTGYGLGHSMLVASLCTAPSGLMMMAAAPVSARLTRRLGAKYSLCAGLAVIAVAYGAASFSMSSTWHLAVASTVMGLGTGLAFAAMPMLVMAAVPAHQTAQGNGLNALVRSLGTSLSSAVMAAVLSASAVTVGSHTVAAESSFRVCLLVGCGAAVAGLLVASALRRPTRG